MNKLNGKFKIGDRVTIHKWYFNNNLPLPQTGTIVDINKFNIDNAPYYIKLDGEDSWGQLNPAWYFKEEEITLIDNNPFTTKSFFTGKNTTPPKTKETPNYEILNLKHGRIALVTEEKVYFFSSATEAAVKESFEEHGEALPEYSDCYIFNYECLENLLSSLEKITGFVNDFAVSVSVFGIGCQEFSLSDLDLVVSTMNSVY